MKRKHVGQAVMGAISIILLNACSSFPGLQKEMYDGKTVSRDEAAISAYSERQEIIGKEKIESFGDEMPAYFLQPALSFLNEAHIELSEEPKAVGKDLPAGRYVIEKPEFSAGATLIVRDEEEKILIQEVLDFYMSSLELDLHPGETIRIAGRDGASLNAVSNSSASGRKENGSSVTLPTGIWRVGEQISAGSYYLSGPDSRSSEVPYLYIINEDGTFRLFELQVDFNVPGGYQIPLELSEGQTLFVKSTPFVSFEAAE